MMNNRNGMILGLLAATAVALTGCGGSGSSDMTGTTGFLSLGVSDGPVHDATKVCIEFEWIELKGEGSPSDRIILDPPVSVNLLEVQGANAAPILSSYGVPAGQYEWMRLGINAERGGLAWMGDIEADTNCAAGGSYIVRSDGPHNIYVPSGANTGLKIVSGFTVPLNSNANLTADFDLTKSFTAPPGHDPEVKMRPTIRLVNNLEIGTLTGQVANELVDAENCEPSVYLFDDGVIPNGIEDEVDDLEDPVATAMLDKQSQDELNYEYHYTMGFLLPRDYEVAFTCDGVNFEPADGKPVSIFVDELTTVDIEAPAPAP